MEDRQRQAAVEENLSVHIFSVSATMVGVCLTVIGLFKIGFKSAMIVSIGDELLACNAGAFLVSCLLAYSALRSHNQWWSHRMERVADTVFLVGLLMMAVICGLVAYEFV